MNCYSRVIEDNDGHRVYMVKQLGNDQITNEVVYNANGSITKCLYLMVTEGIPCWYILCVLRLEDIEELPKS